MYDKLMVAFDGTEPSRRALYAGVELAQRLGRPLRTVTVLESNPVFMAAGGSSPDAVAEMQRSADALAETLRQEVADLSASSGVAIDFETVYGEEVSEIVEAVGRHHADTLIVGLRNHPGLIDRLVSRTARDLSELSPCSVLGVK